VRLEQLAGALFESPRLHSPAECLSRPGPIPNQAGIYAWYFREPPPGVPVADCIVHDACPLLYLGIAPSGPASRSSLQKRIKTHIRGNASSSTLRLSLGCLLSAHLGIQLRRVGPTERFTFAEGESKLSAWLAQNARVTWVVVEEPWQFEPALISRVSLPLNLGENAAHAFSQVLSGVRSAARRQARSLPVLSR
jgi:hypothetical protein